MDAIDAVFFYGTIVITAVLSLMGLFIAAVWPLR